MNSYKIENIAYLTGTNPVAVKKYIDKFGLDTEKIYNDIITCDVDLRMDFASVLSGDPGNNLEKEFNNKYKLIESRRSDDFFSSKIGIAILQLLKGKPFNFKVVDEYLDSLGDGSDLVWTRIMDSIATDLGIDRNLYDNYGEMGKVMLQKIEELYNEYIGKDIHESTIVSKNKIDDLIELNANGMLKPKSKYKKKIIITENQLDMLIQTIRSSRQLGFNLNEGISAFDDIFTFEVYENRLQKFLDKLKELPNFNLVSKKKDGAYYKVKVQNKSSYENWLPLVDYYKTEIKI